MSRELSPAALGRKQRACRKQNECARRVWRLSDRGKEGGRRAAHHRREATRWAERAWKIGKGLSWVPMPAKIPTGNKPATDCAEPSYQ